MTDAPAQQGGQPPKAKVFISYSRKDIAFADRLDAVLKARGFEPLIDRTDIYAFEEWWKRIEDLITRADTVVFVLSPDAIRPASVSLKEVAFAASLNKRFAPIVFRPVQDKDVPEALAKLNFIFFDDPARLDESVDQLAEALRTDIVWIRQHTDFGELARRWTQAKGASGLLLRSPVLEQAERWIASRPAGAPAPTDETQAFIRQSRHGATRRRNVLTGSLAAGLVLALALAGLAYWQRGVALVERDNATRNFKLAQKTTESLVFDIAQGLRNVQGMSAEAGRKILETARASFEQLTTSAPDDLTLQRSRSVMLTEFGDTYLTLGDLAQALDAYRDGLAIRQRLAAADRSNTQWQRDLLVPHQKVGDVLVEQGKLDEALKAYRDVLAMAERLAAGDASNTQWQRDLSVLYERVGNVLRAQGKLDEALKAYRDSLAIRERLAAADRSNTQWQRDLSTSYEGLGNVLMAQGELDEALKACRDGLAITERLAAADRSNAQWQRNLSVSYERVGDVLVRQGKLDEALKTYRDSIAIRERLAAAERSNTQWQRDLAGSHAKLASVYERQGRIAHALQELTQGRDIMAALVAIAPSNAQWQKNLAWLEQQVARLEGQDRAP
jgi:tetratricopeptide (TPR) repeat protein